MKIHIFIDVYSIPRWLHKSLSLTITINYFTFRIFFKYFSLFSYRLPWKYFLSQTWLITILKLFMITESKGYRDIMYYVCTPVYVRCRSSRNCVRSTKMCNGLKSCMNKWNSSNDCVHLKRKLHTMGNDVNVDQKPPARFIGLFFTAFHFYNILFKTT